MKKHLLFILIVYLIGCNKGVNNIYNQYTKFPQEVSITLHKPIALDTILFRFPYRMDIHENVAIIMDLHNEDNYLHAFNLPEWKHIQSFSRRGEGPEEFISCDKIEFISLDSLWSIDGNRMKITRWGMNEQRDSFQIKEQIDLNKELIQVLDFKVLDDGFLIPDYSGETRYCKLDWNGNPVDSFGSIPTIIHKDSKAKMSVAMGWRSFIDYNPTNGVLAFATQLGEVLEIYNLKDSTHHVWYGPNDEPLIKITPDGGFPIGIMGFGNIQVTENYIYTVFEGISFDEKRQMYERGEKPKQGGKYIYVFDLEGNPVCKYNLDHHIYGMHVDEEQGIIIATDLNIDDPILIYNIG